MQEPFNAQQLERYWSLRARGWSAARAFHNARAWSTPQVTSRGYGDSRDTWRHADDFGGMARSW